MVSVRKTYIGQGTCLCVPEIFKILVKWAQKRLKIRLWSESVFVIGLRCVSDKFKHESNMKSWIIFTSIYNVFTIVVESSN